MKHYKEKVNIFDIFLQCISNTTEMPFLKCRKTFPKQIDTINIIEIDFLFWLYLNKFLYNFI